jgi:integrase
MPTSGTSGRARNCSLCQSKVNVGLRKAPRVRVYGGFATRMPAASCAARRPERGCALNAEWFSMGIRASPRWQIPQRSEGRSPHEAWSRYAGAASETPFVFADEDCNVPRVSSLDHLHAKTRKALKLPPEFVLHSLRHTYLTRLGLAGVEAFTIMRLAGHSSVTVGQRYIHPTPQAMEDAVAKTGQYERALVRIDLDRFRKARSLGIYRSARRGFGEAN